MAKVIPKQIPLYLSQNLCSTVIGSNHEDIEEGWVFDSAEVILHVLHECLTPVRDNSPVVLMVDDPKQEGAQVNVRQLLYQSGCRRRFCVDVE